MGVKPWSQKSFRLLILLLFVKKSNNLIFLKMHFFLKFSGQDGIRLSSQLFKYDMDYQVSFFQTSREVKLLPP